jgi:hypothetical protein
MCRLSWNLGASTSWNPQGLSRPVMELLYILPLPGMSSWFLFHRVCSLVTILTELSLLHFGLCWSRVFFYLLEGLCDLIVTHTSTSCFGIITRCVHIRQSALLHNQPWTFHQISCNKVYFDCDVLWQCWPSSGLIFQLENWHRQNWNLEMTPLNRWLGKLNRDILQSDTYTYIQLYLKTLLYVFILAAYKRVVAYSITAVFNFCKRFPMYISQYKTWSRNWS